MKKKQLSLGDITKLTEQFGHIDIYPCEWCGASLTRDAKNAQYAYACGERGRLIHHIQVGGKHFCNLDCFENYKRMRQLRGH